MVMDISDAIVNTSTAVIWAFNMKCKWCRYCYVCVYLRKLTFNFMKGCYFVRNFRNCLDKKKLSGKGHYYKPIRISRLIQIELKHVKSSSYLLSDIVICVSLSES